MSVFYVYMCVHMQQNKHVESFVCQECSLFQLSLSLRDNVSACCEPSPLRYPLTCTATHCNTLQHTATHCKTLQRTATHCNTLQRTATHCNTLQHTTMLPATAFGDLDSLDLTVAVCCSMLQCVAVCCSKVLQQSVAAKCCSKVLQAQHITQPFTPT